MIPRLASKYIKEIIFAIPAKMKEEMTNSH